jgi:hypothetical protein
MDKSYPPVDQANAAVTAAAASASSVAFFLAAVSSTMVSMQGK